MSRPLEGIRVIELGNFIAGPLCGMLLGDMGADVIKIEPTRTGDMTRATGPHVGGESANFLSLNRNKRSIALDLKRPEAVEVARKLAATADVLLENYRPGVLPKLGLGADDLRPLNPDMLYVSVSGFGQTGPYRLRSAVNLVVEAASGTLSISGEPGEIPMRPALQTADVFGAMFATYAVLSGLIGKLRGSAGRVVDLSMVEAAISAAVFETPEYLIGGSVPQPLGHRHRLTAPYEVFRGADGFLVIGCPNDQVFARVMRTLGHEELIDDPRFNSYGKRKQNEEAISKIVADSVRDRAIDPLIDELVRAGVPCSRVNDYRQIFDDPQMVHRNIVVEVDHPAAGPTRMVRNPLLFDADGPTITRPAPMLGQHTAELMQELGYAIGEIGNLAAAGIIEDRKSAVTRGAAREATA